MYLAAGASARRFSGLILRRVEKLGRRRGHNGRRRSRRAHMISCRLWLSDAGSTGAATTPPTFEASRSCTCSTILAASLLASARRYSSPRLAAISRPWSTPCMNSRSLSCAKARTFSRPGGGLHAGAFGSNGANTVGLVISWRTVFGAGREGTGRQNGEGEHGRRWKRGGSQVGNQCRGRHGVSPPFGDLFSIGSAIVRPRFWAAQAFVRLDQWTQATSFRQWK